MRIGTIKKTKRQKLDMMRFKKRSVNRIPPHKRSFSGKRQQSQWSFGKIMTCIFVIWLFVMVFWITHIAIGHRNNIPPNSQTERHTGDDIVNIVKQIPNLPNQGPKEIRLWKPQNLRKLDFTQPHYITEMIKSEYDRAEWKPSNYKKTYDINYDILPQSYLQKIGRSK